MGIKTFILVKIERMNILNILYFLIKLLDNTIKSCQTNSNQFDFYIIHLKALSILIIDYF